MRVMGRTVSAESDGQLLGGVLRSVQRLGKVARKLELGFCCVGRVAPRRLEDHRVRSGRWLVERAERVNRALGAPLALARETLSASVCRNEVWSVWSAAWSTSVMAFSSRRAKMKYPASVATGWQRS